jgi:ammonia channel protein AmtB
LLLYRLTNWIISLRVSPEEEKVGLDLSQHRETLQVS